MRIFASPRMRSIMQGLGMQRGEAIEHKMVTNAIEKAQQKKVEAETSISGNNCQITMTSQMTSGHRSTHSAMS